MSDIVKGVALVATGVILGPIGLGIIGAGFANAAIVVGLSIVSSKLFAPEIPNTLQRLAERQTTVRSTTAHRSIVYGQAMVSGPIAYHNLSGDDGEEIPAADIGWTAGAGGQDGIGSGAVTTSQWVAGTTNAVYIRWALGHRDQVAMAELVSTFSNWTTAHRARGITYGVVSMLYNAATADIWEEYGQPGNIKFVLKGRKVYDPRKYSLNADNNFETVGLAYGAGLRWFTASDQAQPISSTAFQVIQSFGTNWLRYAGNSNATAVSERVTVKSGTNYTVRSDARTITGSGVSNLGIYFYDSNGDVIGSGTSDATGWDSISSVHWFDTGTAYPSTPTTYFLHFGATETATIPTGAAEMALIWSANTAPASGAIIDIRDFAVHQRTRHLIDNQDTWAWSDNPALCLADYLTQVMGVASNRINWADCITTADANDATVSIPPAASPENTETRFTTNGALSLGDSHKDNIEKILTSADMMLRWKQGKWSMRPSVWEDPTVTIDGDWLTDEPIDVKGMDGLQDRFNTIRGFYVDPDRRYEPVEFPEVTAAEYVARDGSKTLSRELELHMTNTHTMAQRIAYRVLEQGDNQIVARTRLNAKAAQLAIGDVVNVDWWPLGWTTGGNRIPNSTDFNAAEYGTAEITLDSGEFSPFGDTTAYKVTIFSVGAGGGGGHFPEGHIPGGHVPGGHVPATAGEGGGGDSQFYVDITGMGNEQSTYAFWIKEGDMSSQFGRVAVQNLTTSPISTVLEYDIDLSDGSVTKVDSNQKNTVRVEPYPNGWHRVFMYVNEGISNTDDVRLYMLKDAGGTEGDTLHLYGPQAISSYAYAMLYQETTGSPVSTSPQTMRVIEWKRLEDGRFDVTLRQSEEGDYADPAVAEYSTYVDGAITKPSPVVPAPTNLTATSGDGFIQWDWDDPASRLYTAIELWVSNDNDRSNAELLITTNASPFRHDNVLEYRGVYAWVRAKDFAGNVSEWHPTSSTGGVVGKPKSRTSHFGLMDPDFASGVIAPAYSALDTGGYWRKSTNDGSCGASWSAAVTLQSGLGSNGGNAVDLVLSDCSDSIVVLNSVGRTFHPFGAVELRVRYKATSGFKGTLWWRFTHFENQTTDTRAEFTTGQALTTEFPGQSGATTMVTDGTWSLWHDVVDVPKTIGDYLNIRLYCNTLTGQDASSDYLRIDYVNIYPVETP